MRAFELAKSAPKPPCPGRAKVAAEAAGKVKKICRDSRPVFIFRGSTTEIAAAWMQAARRGKASASREAAPPEAVPPDKTPFGLGFDRAATAAPG